MTSFDFNNLSLEDKAEVLVVIGTYLHGINYYGHRANLYSLGNLFVETKLDTISNDIIEIEIIDENKMEKYMSRIRLEL